MGKYIVIEHDNRYFFTLTASNGHALMSSIVFSSLEECLHAIDCIKSGAATAELEDTTLNAFARQASPKFRIYEDFNGNYFFRYITDDAGDIAESHTYELKESLLRRIERMRQEAESEVSVPSTLLT